MIEAILPPQVAAVDTREELLDIELFPQERAALGQAVEKRRREFITARACARRALTQLGLPPSPIGAGERGQPLWPAGVVGSITHCSTYRACAVARADELAGLGIDAEPNRPLPEGVVDQIARPEERPGLAELTRTQPLVNWDRLLFSAKETVYKVWFPLAGCWLGFDDARLTLHPTPGADRAPGVDRAHGADSPHGADRPPGVDRAHGADSPHGVDRAHGADLPHGADPAHGADSPHGADRPPGADSPHGADPARGTFTARLLRPWPDAAGNGLPSAIEGLWLAQAGLVLTAIALPSSRMFGDSGN